VEILKLFYGEDPEKAILQMQQENKRIKFDE
jgi:Trm5-related predicted tRNA methylase